METFITQPCYLFVKDLLTFGLTAWGLVIATRGLATWKKQIKGSKEFEAGYNLHYAVLKLRDAIKYVRNPAIWPSESSRAMQYSKTKYPDKSPEEIEKNSHVYVYEMRWEKISEAATEMESHLLAAEVLWGSEILELEKSLRLKISELNIALRERFEPEPELRTRKPMEIHDIIYDKGNYNKDEDAFSKGVNAAVDAIANYIKSKTA